MLARAHAQSLRDACATNDFAQLAPTLAHALRDACANNTFQQQLVIYISNSLYKPLQGPFHQRSCTYIAVYVMTKWSVL